MLGLRKCLKFLMCFGIIFYGITVIAQENSSLPPKPEILNQSKQLVLVITPSWEDPNGSMQRFERSDPAQEWQPVGQSWPIVVGRKGLGWENGLQNFANGSPVKHEGDLKSPAGAFKIESAFGFADTPPSAINMTYNPITRNTVCVDDVNSQYYGQIVDSSKVPAIDWQDGENMSTVAVYKQGFVVNYNLDGKLSGGGSCIFIHLKDKNNKTGTHGCTAMDSDFMTNLWDWINANENPVLVQLPKDQYLRLQESWNLPRLPIS